MSLPAAIIIAGAIIAIALIWINRPAGTLPSKNSALPQPGSGTGTMSAVTSEDHIIGNPNAAVKIVEYSDPSCPYCKTFNPIMQRVITEYGPGGSVAWVYRHFALDKPDENGDILHPNSGRQARAMECAAALGGNTAFWAYEKKWYESFPSDGANRSRTLDDAQIAEVAKSVNLDPVSFNDCLASGRFQDRVDQQFTDGINAGVSGTPYTIILTPSGSKIPLPGLTDYATIKKALDIIVSSVTSDSSSK